MQRKVVVVCLVPLSTVQTSCVLCCRPQCINPCPGKCRECSRTNNHLVETHPAGICVSEYPQKKAELTRPLSLGLHPKSAAMGITATDMFTCKIAAC